MKDSRPREAGGVRRRRSCPRCGLKVTTYELPAGEAEQVLAQASHHHPIVAKQASELVTMLAEMDAEDRVVLLSVARRLTGGGRSKRLRSNGAAVLDGAGVTQ